MTEIDVGQMVQISAFMAPCRIDAVLAVGSGCSSYGVSLAGADGSGKNMILLAYDEKTGNRFELAVATLNRIQYMGIQEQIPCSWNICVCEGGQYILIDADHRKCLTLEAVKKLPTGERFRVLNELVAAVAALESRGVLPARVSWANILWDEDGKPCFWNMTDAIIQKDLTEAVWDEAHRRLVSELTQFIYHAIMGKVLPDADMTPNLILTLCGRVEAQDLNDFCNTLDNCRTAPTQRAVSDLLDSLEYIRACIQEPADGESAEQLEPYQMAAEFLNRNPLYPYVRTLDDGTKRLNIIMYGNSPLREALLYTIIPAVQMLDTQLHIHIIAQDAAAFWDEIRKNAPLLEQAALVNHIPASDEADTGLIERITGRDSRGEISPFVHLTFETVQSLATCTMLRQETMDCLFLLEYYDDDLRAQLCDWINNCNSPLLVAVCHNRPMAYHHVGSRKLAEIRSFVCDGADTPFEQTSIYRKAYSIHTFYEKDMDQRAREQKILESFRDRYNQRSSIRSALNIPYKLYSCGLAGMENESEQFYRNVLMDQDKRMLCRLIWLEHRSWQAHLILNGWVLNPDDFDGGFEAEAFSQKNNKKRWHACLCGSNDTGTVPLQAWNMADWDDESRDLSALDPLDRMSISIHHGLRRKVEKHKNERTACLDGLKNKLDAHLYQQVCAAMDRLQNCVPNAGRSWKQVLTELNQQDDDVKKLAVFATELIQRNQCRDFKQSDSAILHAIPFLLQNEPIRCIYKLCAEHDWDNIATTLFIEPQKLVLLPNAQRPVTPKDIERYCRVLCDQRSMALSVTCAGELDVLEKNAVLDVTGADAEQILKAQETPLLRDLPLVAYRKGALISPDESCMQVRFYPTNRSLTVEETMAIGGAEVLSEQSEIPMYSMRRYDELWKVVQIAGEAYTPVSDYLGFMKKSHKVYRGKHEWTTDMPLDTAKSFGFIDLLDQMVEQGIIRRYSRHTAIQPVNAKYFERVKLALDKVEKRILDAGSPGDCNFLVVPRGAGRWEIRCNGMDPVLIYEITNGWLAQYSRADAQSNGLLELLKKLEDRRIIKSFAFSDVNGEYPYIYAKDAYCQHSLNAMLDAYDEAVRNNCQHGLFLNFMPENPDDLCELEAADLEFQAEMVVRYDRDKEDSYHTYELRKKKYRRVYCEDLSGCLDALLDYGFIEKVGSDPLYCHNNGKFCVHFRYADHPTKSCLTKAGNALEALTYHTIRRMNLFDDVKLGVSIQWDDQDVVGMDTRNEIDVICTKGMKSYFISCKQTHELTNDYLNEICYETERFGLEGTPILVTTATRNANPAQYARAERMGVRIITLTRKKFRKDYLADGAKELEEQLRANIENI